MSTTDPEAVLYLARPAEKLVLDGYRAVMAACARADLAGLDAMHAAYFVALGEAEAEAALVSLGKFILTLGRCAACPLGHFPCGTRHLCRDETLVLGLVSALQHGDDEAVKLAAEALTCRLRAIPLVAAAADYAMMLKYSGCSLLPISSDVLSSIITRAAMAERGLATRLN